MTRALDFYRNAVGLGVEMEGPAFSFLAAGTIRVALNEVAGLEGDATGTEIVLEVEDIHAAYEAMQQRGVPFAVSPRPVTATDGRTLLAAHFRDPDGHVWSVTGWVDTPSAEAID
jgi:catechol 2,3-dioxygenase-like lactoylglutathione lyase family enzyme